MKEELLKGLTKEQIAKAKACQSHTQLLTLAENEGIELNDEQLAAVSGGGCFSTPGCSNCGSTDIKETFHPGNSTYSGDYYICKCRNCGATWHIYIN